jgi:hypothetical protein
MNDKILDVISKHTVGVPKAKTLEDLADLENNTVKELETLFSLHVVSHQRGLLKAFQEFYQSDKFDEERTFEWNINHFLRAFNCG